MDGSSSKPLETSGESNDEVIELRSLPIANPIIKQDKYWDLRGLMETFQSTKVLKMLRKTPELARVVDEDGDTLLHCACHDECLEIIQVLVELFPRALQHKNLYGKLPLHRACSYDGPVSFDVVQFLVEKYLKALEARDRKGDLPLHVACLDISSSLDVVRVLVEQYPEALKAGNRYGDLPLHIACANGACSLEVIRYVLEQFANALERKNSRGVLPLHFCIHGFKDRHIDYASLLDRMMLLLPRYPEAIDVAPHFHGDEDDEDWSLWPTREEHELYKEVAGLLLEQTFLRDQLEWAEQVVVVLSLVNSSVGMETACSWATEWRDVCRGRLNEIEARLANMETLLEEFRALELHRFIL